MAIPRTEEKERVLLEFDEFRADPVRRLLLRAGEPVAVTPKALSILLVLLERPGEVVEKAELIERVWPGTFVTEANLTQNVFSLRKSLGERANEPRYVLTIPGRGYSFAGDVRRIDRAVTSEIPIAAIASLIPESLAPAVEEPGEQTAVSSPWPPAAAVPATPGHRRSFAKWAGLSLALLAVAGVVVAGILQTRPRRDPKATPAAHSLRPSVAVLDFRSLSPSPETKWLEIAFAEMLTTELAAGGDLRVVRGENLAEAQRSVTFQEDGGLGRDDVRKLHEVLGADFLVLGSYFPMGGKIRLDLRVIRAPEGSTVVSLAEVGTEPGLFDLVSRTGEDLRVALGVAAPSVEQVQQARALQPSSTEASRLYAQGLERLRAFDPPGALGLLQRAAQADPKSAAIHFSLSQTWWDLGQDARATEEARRAVDLSRSLSRQERLAIQGWLYQVSRQWEKAIETYRSLWTFYPDDAAFGLQLVECLTSSGRAAEAVETIAALRALPPPQGDDPQIDLAESRNALRLSDAATQKRAAEAAEAKGRRSGQTLVVARALVFHGDSLLKVGRSREALPLFQEAVTLARAAGHQWVVGMALANEGVAWKNLGDLAEAERVNREALSIAQRLGSSVGIAAQLYYLGELRWQRGDLAEAQRLLEQSYDHYVKSDDPLKQVRSLSLLGEVLCAGGDLAGARKRFETALALSRSLGNPVSEAKVLGNLGFALVLQGKLSEARSLYERAFFLSRKAGDSSLGASFLTGLAEVAARQGDLRTAWQRSAQALAVKSRVGDRIGVAQILGSRARLAFLRGDLAASRTLAEDQLHLARQTGTRALAARALLNLGHADLATGDLDGARRSFEEALQTSSILGEELLTAEIRRDLARLMLSAGRTAEASHLSRELAAWYQARKMSRDEALALTTLAGALLQEGKRREAQKVAAQARARLAVSEDRQLRLEAAVPLAQFALAAGFPAAALRELRQASEEARRLGFVTLDLEARFALGEIQRRAGDPAAGATLAAVRRDAEVRGFKRFYSAATPISSSSGRAASPSSVSSSHKR